MMLQSREYLIMRRYTLIGLCTLCIWLMAGEGGAQTVIRSTGYDVLFRPNSSRTTALSEAGVGLIGSGQAIFYNPSGLAFMGTISLSNLYHLDALIDIPPPILYISA